MPFEEAIKTKSGMAGADLSTSQFYAIINNSSGLMVVATAAANMDGLLADNPANNRIGSYVFDGTANAAISASNALSKGSLLEVDTGGTLKLHASGTVVAKSREALTSNASVCIVAVDILRSNATF